MAWAANCARLVQIFCPWIRQPPSAFVGLRTQRGEVGPRVGFGEELAPDLLAGENRPQEAPFLGLRPEVGDGRAGEILPDGVEPLRRSGPIALFAEDRPHPLVQPLPAVLAGPGQPGIPGLEEHGLPRPPERRLLGQVCGLGPGQLGEALLQPGAQVVTEPRLVRRIREIHPSPTSWSWHQTIL